MGAVERAGGGSGGGASTHLGLRGDAEDDTELAAVVAVVDEHEAARLHVAGVRLRRERRNTGQGNV